MSKNLILTAANQNLEVSNFLDIPDRGSIIGLPLGTSDGSATGEIAVKTILVGDTADTLNSGMPYNAASQAITNVSAGPNVIIYKDTSGATLKTRTFTYTNGGASSTDVLTNVTDT